MSVIDLDSDRLDLSFSGSYPVKVSSLRDFEVLSRDMIRILSHAETFFICDIKMFAKGKYGLQGFFMDPYIHVYDIHGLHVHGHCTDSRPTIDELRGGHRIGAKGSLQRQ